MGRQKEATVGLRQTGKWQ